MPDDLGLKLMFGDSESAVAFSREMDRAKPQRQEFRVVVFDSKLNFDANTMVLVLKIAGDAATAIAAFLALTESILTVIKKPAVKIEINGKRVELYAKASPDDIKSLCDVLLRAGK